jgi:type II secretory pathway component PulK
MPAQRYCHGDEGGVALAILVWFLAAMSLLVAGIVMQARIDIKLTQFHVARARAEAVADGAIQLALAHMMQPVKEGESTQQVLQGLVYPLGNLNVQVNVTPLSGLINLNEAPEELLALLLLSVEGLDEGAARELAFNVVEWRTPGLHAGGELQSSAREYSRGDDVETVDPTDPGATSSRRFEAIEDLLLVAGIDRRVYEAVQDAIYVSQEGQSGVDWATAPVVILRGLLGGDAESAQALVEARVSDEQEGLVAPSDMDLRFQEASITTAYRIDAMVEVDGSVFNRRRWVDTGRPGQDGLPWSFFRTEALRVLPATAGAEMPIAEVDRAGS